MTTSQLLRLPSRRATRQTMASQLDFKLISAATAIAIIASTQHLPKSTSSAASTTKHIENGNHISISFTPSSKLYNSTMHWQFSSLRSGTLQSKISISRLTKSELERFGLPNEDEEFGSDHYGVCATLALSRSKSGDASFSSITMPSSKKDSNFTPIHR